MTNLILFGPPGSGKGTQAAILIDKYNLVHISTGDMFRIEIGNQTKLGIEAKTYMDQGKLVPDEITIGMFRNKVEAHPDAAGFIFDGFPRTIPQAEALDALLLSLNTSIKALIALNVDEEEVVNRILKRGKTSGRGDDNDEIIIRNRYQAYKDYTAQVYDYYAQHGKSHSINGIGAIDEIAGHLSAIIEKL